MSYLCNFKFRGVMFDGREYTIEISKLVKGNNAFEFDVSKDLFEFFECTEVNDVKAKVNVNVVKNERLIEFAFDFKGVLNVNCSRCLSEMDLQIDKKTHLYVKISQLDDKGKIQEIDVNEWLVDENENSLDFASYIYEELRVEIPIAPVHKKKSDCNKEMLDKLSQINEEGLQNKEEFDPRWEKLRELIKE